MSASQILEFRNTSQPVKRVVHWGSPFIYMPSSILQTLLLFIHWVVSDSVETPWAVVRQAPLCVEFSRQENCSGLLFPSPGDLPDPGISCTGRQILYHWATREIPCHTRKSAKFINMKHLVFFNYKPSFDVWLSGLWCENPYVPASPSPLWSCPPEQSEKLPSGLAVFRNSAK